MLKWTRTHGCNCHPLAEGAESYIIDVGDIWGGTVKSYPTEDPGQFRWEAWYTVFGQQVSGQSGGPWGREDHMKWVEERILAAIQMVESAKTEPVRRVFDSLCQKNEETGEFFQEEIFFEKDKSQ